MIPERFKEKMSKLLGEEYPAFINALENKDAVRGLRVNLSKITVEDFLKKTELPIEQLSYTDNGFILKSTDPVGNTPEHHSGMIYMQDPGAMASISGIDIDPSWWVADLCSAPGGKSTQIAERLGVDGFLLSNEYVPKRAKIIVGNFERLGVKNAIVTSLDTKELARMYREVFDLVVVDAPCSGEGMFRKSDEALEAWTPENVEICSKRQREILENAHSLVKPGGYLLYSTCTYSPEENEDVIISFIDEHPEFNIERVRADIEKKTRPGIAREGKEHIHTELTRRFYPHISDGEGQYLALLKKDGNLPDRSTILYKDEIKPPSKQEMSIIDAFVSESLTDVPSGRICKIGENIVILHKDFPLPQRSVFMSGILFGEIKGKLFVPSHQFFSAYGKLFKLQEDLKKGDIRVEKYLRGEEIDTVADIKGWCSVLYEGVPLGGGKASGGKIKNHYPKGLRNN